jgi:HD-like signal output (HDOD) protein
MRLVELASDEKSSTQDLVSLIEKDPSLSVRLLQMANSAFFSSAHQVKTLQQAIVKVGFNRLRIMALSISLRDTFPMGKVGVLDYEKFWRMSLYRALISKSLAEHISQTNPDEAFVGGLTMEIGLLILFDLFLRKEEDTINVQLDSDSLTDLLQWEQGKYGMDHRQVGEAALGFWNFPDDIIACQKTPESIKNSPDLPPIARICELARTLSRTMFLEKRNFQSIYCQAEQYLKINGDIMSEILIATFNQVEDIANSLNIEINGERDLLLLMEKANQALSRISAKISREEDEKKRLGKRDLPSFESMEVDDPIIANTLQAVAHEIRNPLLAVGGFARKLSTTLDPDSKNGKYVQIILEEARRLESALAEMIKDTA